MFDSDEDDDAEDGGRELRVDQTRKWFDEAVDALAEMPVPKELGEFAMEFLADVKLPLNGLLELSYNFLDAVVLRAKRGDRRVQVYFKAHHPRIVVMKSVDGEDAVPYGVLVDHVAVVSAYLAWVSGLTDGEGDLGLNGPAA